MTNLVLPFSLRKVPLGDADSLSIEVAVLQWGDVTWWVLREPRGQQRSAPGLVDCYWSHLMECLRVELVHMRGLSAPTRVFQCTYALSSSKSDPVQWLFREHPLSPTGDQLVAAPGLSVAGPTRQLLIGALKMSESPKRLLQ